MQTSDRARIVVADDHPRMLDAVTATLSQSFDVVASAADGPSAIEAALRLRPDAVVLDVAMPGLDGFQTAARLKTAGLDARVVFLSNYTGDDYVLAGMTHGASAFVAKARMERDLVAAVGHALAGRTFIPSAGVLPRWTRSGDRRHDLQLYATDASLVDAVTGFFDSALEAGHAIMTIASAPHRQAVDAQLRARGLDVDALLETGRYTVMDAAEALDAVLRDGMPDRDLYLAAVEPIAERALAAAVGSPPHVCIWGEIAPILCARGDFEAMVRLERIAAEFAAAHAVSILCAYSTECVTGAATAVMASICAEHSTIVPAI